MHSESRRNPLVVEGSISTNFSECALINQANYPDWRTGGLQFYFWNSAKSQIVPSAYWRRPVQKISERTCPLGATRVAVDELRFLVEARG